MIDPRTVIVATPTFDDCNVSGYTDGLARCAASGMHAGRIKIAGCDVRLARNILTHRFKMSEMQWMVFIDADIEFTPLDFALLMDYRLDNPVEPPDRGLVENATVMHVEGSEWPAILSTAEYSRKVDTMDPVRFGLGFTRIHRSVFDRLDAMNNDDGSAKLDSFPYQGQMITDYYLSGCLTHHWYGEDQGFFELVKLAGITPKIEQRCGLVHWGRKAYPYNAKQGGW
jgi:hypothetical protein